jgi:hypothetical protein
MFLAIFKKLWAISDLGSSETIGTLLIIDFLILEELCIDPT